MTDVERQRTVDDDGRWTGTDVLFARLVAPHIQTTILPAVTACLQYLYNTSVNTSKIVRIQYEFESSEL